MKIGPRLPKLS